MSQGEQRSANATPKEAVTFAGMRIIQSVDLVEDGEPYVVPRTWRERLFTLPWRPHVGTKTIVPKVPYRGALKLAGNTLVMHPATLRQFMETKRESPEVG